MGPIPLLNSRKTDRNGFLAGDSRPGPGYGYGYGYKIFFNIWFLNWFGVQLIILSSRATNIFNYSI